MWFVDPVLIPTDFILLWLLFLALMLSNRSVGDKGVIRSSSCLSIAQLWDRILLRYGLVCEK